MKSIISFQKSVEAHMILAENGVFCYNWSSEGNDYECTLEKKVKPQFSIISKKNTKKGKYPKFSLW